MNNQEVTNLIEPVLLTKRHLVTVGKSKLSDLTPILKMISKEWGLSLNRVSHFKIAVKILEQSIIKN